MKMKCTLLLLVAALFGSCSSDPVEVVDLNKVLDIFEKTMKDLDKTEVASVDKVDAAAGAKKPNVDQINSKTIKEAELKKFITKFEGNLNAAKLMKEPIVVKMGTNGSLNGYSDKNKNKKMDGGEPQLFKIEIDVERSRVIATEEGL